MVFLLPNDKRETGANMRVPEVIERAHGLAMPRTSTRRSDTSREALYFAKLEHMAAELAKLKADLAR